jgi:hypothetical protein
MELRIARYYERLYRFALLVAGNQQAAIQAVVAAFRQLDPASEDPEASLIAALLPAPGARWRLRPDRASLAAAGLNMQQAMALFKALARLTPEARHQLASFIYLDSSTPLEPQTRVELAIALGYLKPTVERMAATRMAAFLNDQLPPEATLAVQSALLTDAPTRELRTGLLQTSTLLRQALPTLFRVDPPPQLLAHLEQPARQVQRAQYAQARLAVVGIVLLLVAALLGLPELWRVVRPAPQVGEGASNRTSAAALLERSLNRLAQPTGSGGVVHERYLAEFGKQRWTLERWLEPQAPYRLAMHVFNSDELVLYGVTIDEDGRVQYRMLADERSRGFDFTTTPERLAQALPTLRQQPDSVAFMIGAPSNYSLDRWYLAQARNNNPVGLGQTVRNGREAQLISYQTMQPYPRDDSDASEAQPTPAQVILAIDQASLAVLEVTVTVQREGQSEVSQPWQAEVIEAVAAAPEGIWNQPVASDQHNAGELLSPRLFEVSATDRVLSLPEVQTTVTETLYLPTYTPELGMNIFLRGETPGDLIYFHEGPQSFMAIFWRATNAQRNPLPENSGAALRAGEHYYYLPPDDEEFANQGTSIAIISPTVPDRPRMQIIFNHQYLSQAERERELAAIIASLRE